MTDNGLSSDPIIDSMSLVRLLAEPDRRRVVAALILESGDLRYLATATGLDVRTLVNATSRLTRSGLVEEGSDGHFVVIEQAFKQAAQPGPQTTSAGEASNEAGASEYEKVLSQCFRDGRLVHLPRKRSKRLIVLDHLAQQFEPGIRYSERQVNSVLRHYDDDVATLRRYLIDNMFLDRAAGEYWRSGGTVDL